MNQRVRGAATVSVMWVIFLLVFLFALGGFLYVVLTERAGKDKQIGDLQTNLEKIQKTNQDNVAKMMAISTAVGFREADSQDPYSRSQEVAGRIADLRTNYKFIGDDIQSVDSLISLMIARVDALTLQVAEKEQQRVASEDARSAADRAMRDMESTKDTRITELEGEVQDSNSRAATNEDRDSQRIATLQQEVDDARARERDARDEAEKAVAAAQEELAALEARVEDMARKVAFLRNPEEPDGEVLAVSNVGTLSIDRGRKDLLRAGTRFQVFRYGKAGRIMPKGMIEVSKTGEDQSEALVISNIDPLDPIAPGDMIAAPTYDPEMPREFVLVGRFPAGFSREIVSARLRSLGAKVESKVSASTDVLIVGDTEVSLDGEGMDDGDPTESEAFRLAQAWRIQTLPVREILDFLRYD